MSVMNLALLVMLWIVIANVITFRLSKRKTQTPGITMFLGFLLSFIPPLSIIYLILLVLKNDIIENKSVA